MNLPSHPDLEYAVVGYCLTEGAAGAAKVLNLLPVEACFLDDCQSALRIVERMVGENKTVDSLAFDTAWKEEHKSRAPTRIFAAQDQAPSGDGVRDYCEKIIDSWDRRRIILAADVLLHGAQDPSKPVVDLIASADETIRKREHRSLPQLGPKECARAFLDEMERRSELAGKRTGVETGFYRLDDMTDGFQFGEQTVIGARPGIGKTAIACCIVNHACLRNLVPTLFVTLEMSPAALTTRMFCSWTGTPMNDVKRGKLQNGQMDAAAKFMLMLKTKPFYVCDAIRGITLPHLSAIWRYHARVNGIKLVIVDYLQKVRPTQKHEKRTYEVAEVSNGLKAVASETHCALLTLCQLNREVDKEKKGRMPRCSDLADSAQIERDADAVLLLHRDTVNKPGHAVVSIAKQRDGELGFLELGFQGQFCRFVNPAPDVEPEPQPYHERIPEPAVETVRPLPYKDA